jgi:hypothetical protein
MIYNYIYIMELGHLLIVANGFLGIFLLLLAYTYIDKLEKIGCACAESKYKKFIKNFALFAVVYLFVTMLIPPNGAVQLFGAAGSFVFKVVNLAFYILSFVFFVISIVYVRNLMKEKCKCSEDVRREILYVYSIVEVIMLSLNIVFGLMLFLVSGAIGLAVATLDNIEKDGPVIRETVSNPVKSLRSVPRDFKKVAKSLKKTLKGK